MKPIELTVSAFGPYPEELTIPMRQLGEHGLFLVTGDTGAGKTSIFDAICFALFGEVSGSQRAADQLRSDFAKPETETFVRFVFTHGGERYDILRTPKYERPKKRGTGTVTQAANAVLTRPDGATIAGATAVTEEMERVLGVGCASFKQISMIAQGEFMKLLTADSKTRAEIIRRVLHTEPLVGLQRRLKEVYLASSRACEGRRQAAAQYAESFRLETDEKPEGLTALLEVVRAQNARDEAYAVHAETELEQLRQEQQKAIEAVVRAKQENARIESYQTACTQLAALEQKRGETEQGRARVQEARRAREIVYPAWTLWEREQTRAAQLAEKQTALAEKLKELRAQRGEQERRRDAAEQTRPEMEQLERQLTRLADAQERAQQWRQADAQVKKLGQQVRRQEKAVEQARQTQAEQALQLEALQKQIAQLAALRLEVERLRGEWSQSKQAERRMQRVQEQFSQLDELETQRKAGQKAYLAAERSFLQAEERARESELAWNREQAGILAQSLTEGQPCPVCGAVHHPAPAALSEGAPSETQLNRLKKQLEQKRTDYMDTREKCSTLRIQSEQLRKDIADALTELEQPTELTGTQLNELYQARQQRTEELQQQGSALSKKIGQLERKARQEETLKGALREAEQSTQQAEQTLREAETKAAAQQAAAQQLRESIPAEDIDALDGQIKACAQQRAMLERQQQAAKDAWEQYRQAVFRAEEQERQTREQCARCGQEAQTAREQWRAALTQAGFADGAQYQSALMTPEALRALEESLQEYDRQLAAAAQLRAEYIDAAALERRDIEQLERASAQAQEKTQDCEAKLHRCAERHKANAQSLRRVEQTLRETAELEQQTAALREMAQTANGELSGRQKLMLEQYIQAAYFERILHRANLRLSEMTQGRYAMRRREKAENNRSHTGLEIDVMDYYTGKTRSVKTLSGGESFLGALALALGMSDIIQSYAGGVRVETVFIDEGFGSLDSTSLEQAISALVRLSKGDRLIGIISHVAELKERIDRQIVVRRAATGSTAEVVPG